MIKKQIHKKIIEQKSKIESWFFEKEQDMFFPFYASFDIRDSGKKIAPIDANLFPAGFNNICPADLDHMPPIIKDYIQHNHKDAKNIILLAEEHTKNLYYWDNVASIKQMLEQAGFNVRVCVPGKNILKSIELISARGIKINIHLLHEYIKKTDLIISNNDFSVDYNLSTTTPFNIPPKMGWKFRRKHHFFKEYNLLAKDFASLIDIPSWHITVKTELFKPFNIDNPESIQKLKTDTSDFLQQLKSVSQKTSDTPFIFIKNNAGTYGLGVTSIQSPDDIDNWNYKLRKSMKAAKGGIKFDEIILQEGIVTKLHDKEGYAEPVIYTIGSHLVGGFLRVHASKKETENLNSPGAVFKQLCMSDLKIQIHGKEEENVYGWITRLSLLALSNEIKHHS